MLLLFVRSTFSQRCSGTASVSHLPVLYFFLAGGVLPLHRSGDREGKGPGIIRQ